MKRLLKGLFALFLTYHLVVTLEGLVPPDSELKKTSEPYFDWYTRATGTGQSWGMFATIPYLHKQTVVLEVTDQEGTPINAGPLLPDLAPYDPKCFRYFGTMVNMKEKPYKDLLQAYANQVKFRLEQEHQTKITFIKIRYIWDQFRFPARILPNGRVNTRKHIVEKPFSWD